MNKSTETISELMKDEAAAVQLAELVLSMNFINPTGLLAKSLARRVLGVEDFGKAPRVVPIVTNGTIRLVPPDEPVFLLRGQDVNGGAAVRAWADMAESVGASAEICRTARDHATEMEAWAVKKVPDLPVRDEV